MENLAKALIREAGHVESNTEDDDRFIPGVGPLNKAAKEWAVASLGEYRDDLLRKALAVSEAITNFTAELVACVKS